jgi:hypothetical protein
MAVTVATKEELQAFPSAAVSLLAKNSHPGHQPSRTTFRLGTTLAISNTATAMPPFCYESLLGFAVVSGNPLTFTDPSGLVEQAGGGGDSGGGGGIINFIVHGIVAVIQGAFGGGSNPNSPQGHLSNVAWTPPPTVYTLPGLTYSADAYCYGCLQGKMIPTVIPFPQFFQVDPAKVYTIPGLVFRAQATGYAPQVLGAMSFRPPQSVFKPGQRFQPARRIPRGTPDPDLRPCKEPAPEIKPGDPYDQPFGKWVAALIAVADYLDTTFVPGIVNTRDLTKGRTCDTVWH